MLGYIIRRVLWIIPVLFFVSVITFVLMRATPSSRRLVRWWPPRGSGVVAALNQRYGLNDPAPVQYLRWVGNLIRGDLGPSYKYRDRTVNDIVGDGIWITVHLGLMAFALRVSGRDPAGGDRRITAQQVPGLSRDVREHHRHRDAQLRPVDPALLSSSASCSTGSPPRVGRPGPLVLPTVSLAAPDRRRSLATPGPACSR